jgi:hypothetical protein
MKTARIGVKPLADAWMHAIIGPDARPDVRAVKAGSRCPWGKRGTPEAGRVGVPTEPHVEAAPRRLDACLRSWPDEDGGGGYRIMSLSADKATLMRSREASESRQAADAFGFT